MVRLCLHDTDCLRIHSYAWLCSLLLHVAILSASVELIKRVTISPIPEPFRWEVSLVNLSAAAADGTPTDSPTTAEGQPDLSSTSNLLSDSPADQGMPDVTAAEASRAAAHPIAEPEQTQPIALKGQSAGSSQSTNQLIVSPSLTAEEAFPIGTKLPQLEREEIPHAALESRKMLPSRSDATRPMEIEQKVDVSPSSSPPSMTAPPSPIGNEIGQHAPQETGISTEPIQPSSDQAQELARGEANSERVMTNHLPPSHGQAQDFSAGTDVAKPIARDYGWLLSALSRRFEDLKRQSRPFMYVSGRKIVLVRVVILEGGNLGEIKIERTSGEDHLDQEAIRLVQLAFPMPLDYALGRSHVVVRVPISYGLVSDCPLCQHT
jgi:protein TonB